MYFKRLKELRKQYNLTQEDVAKLLFCQRTVYQRYETGMCEIPIAHLIILVKYYKVSSDYILELTD